jgi:hypothetical protein
MGEAGILRDEPDDGHEEGLKGRENRETGGQKINKYHLPESLSFPLHPKSFINRP